MQKTEINDGAGTVIPLVNERLIDKDWLLSRKKTKCQSFQPKKTNMMNLYKQISTPIIFCLFPHFNLFYDVK